MQNLQLFLLFFKHFNLQFIPFIVELRSLVVCSLSSEKAKTSVNKCSFTSAKKHWNSSINRQFIRYVALINDCQHQKQRVHNYNVSVFNVIINLNILNKGKLNFVWRALSFIFLLLITCLGAWHAFVSIFPRYKVASLVCDLLREKN